MRSAKAAGWRPPPGHPGIDPPHEALQLAEKNRELARLPEVRGRPEEFRRWAGEAEAEARALEAALRRGEGAAEAFRQAEASCRRCPAPYRDVPQRP